MVYVQIPKDVIQSNKHVMLSSDVIFVNNLPFVISDVSGVRLMMAEFTFTLMTHQLACNLK